MQDMGFMAKAIVLSDEQLQEPYELLATGTSTRDLAKIMGINRGTMFRELTRTPERQQRYQLALVAKGAFLADEIMDVADDPEIPSDQKRIMVDSRKWLAGKYFGKLFGENGYGTNINIESNGTQKRLVVEIAQGKNRAKITEEPEEEKDVTDV